MKTVTLEELLEAGAHFGHQVTRQNPKSRDFVFEARDGIHIIDLAKTKEGLEEAARFIKSIAEKDGSTMILVGTKKQADVTVKNEVQRAEKEGATGLFFVTKRWIGGTLTNFSEVLKNVKRLKELTELMGKPSEKARYTKRELSLWDKERQKLESFYGGIQAMNKMPDALFIVDTHNEHLAVLEARNTKVKTVGMVDTNADPDIIDFPIPANDDAAGSIEFIAKHVVDAWIEGRKKAAQGADETNGTRKLEVVEKADEKESKTAKKAKKTEDTVEEALVDVANSADQSESTKEMEKEERAAKETKAAKGTSGTKTKKTPAKKKNDK